MIEITQEDIIEYLGNFRTKIGGEMIRQCPLCMDKSQDNLHYNPKKNILWCFADESHSKQILSEIYKKKHEQIKKENAEIPNYIKYQKDYIIYQMVCNAMLLGDIDSFNIYYESGDIARLWESEKITEEFNKIIHSDKPERARTYLENRRGINKPTIQKTGLGIDFEKYGKWVIPIYDIDTLLVGFEYRALDFDKKWIWRENGTPRCLARVYGNNKNENCYICEGYMDAYILIQILEKNNKLDCSSIYTSANGVQHTIKIIEQLNFNNFKNFYLCLDNDKKKEKIIKNGKPQDVSRQQTKAIIEKFPFFVDKTPQFTDEEIESGLKDISDWYTHKFMVK